MNLRRLLLAACVALLATAGPAPTAGAYYSGHKAVRGNPLAGHPWFADREWGPAYVTLRNLGGRHAHPLDVIGREPATKGFGEWNRSPAFNVGSFLNRAQHTSAPGTITFIALSRIEHQSCPYRNPGRNATARYKKWVNGFVKGIGRHRVMVNIEPDRLATLYCLPGAAQKRRLALIRYDVAQLHRHAPNAIVYLDAGASDWRPAAQMARELKAAGIAHVQGFALNASHYDWTSKNIRYGLKISRYLHGKHFVISTARNGRGPAPHRRGVDRGCNPPNEGLGVRPTIKTPRRQIDAFLWLGIPGVSDGVCNGVHDPSGTFSLKVALRLVSHAVFSHYR